MTILWSIVPTSDVFAGHAARAEAYQQIEVEGATMLVEPAGHGMARIERLLSGNPQHYLRPEWQPGSLIRFP